MKDTKQHSSARIPITHHSKHNIPQLNTTHISIEAKTIKQTLLSINNLTTWNTNYVYIERRLLLDLRSFGPKKTTTHGKAPTRKKMNPASKKIFSTSKSWEAAILVTIKRGWLPSDVVVVDGIRPLSSFPTTVSDNCFQPSALVWPKSTVGVKVSGFLDLALIFLSSVILFLTNCFIYLFIVLLFYFFILSFIL